MISVKDLKMRVGDFQLSGISFAVPCSAYAVMMGKTGSGKTSLLECICGLRHVDAGTIHLGDRDVTRLKPAERGIGYVPQDGALFPTMTVRHHLDFPLVVRHWKREHIQERTHELADLLGIEYLLDRKPKGLSGGESQRVALGRALAFEPNILLLDEPLSALDDSTRQQMYGLLRRVSEQTKVTVLHITHSQSEADELADVRLTLRDGQVS